ncbi:heparin-binding hemagglutinin [Antrihabitans stalactiti]|uniref:Heparin-binding hemagglutinin n=1 Tax=Antrihabitans stalactiti TaxID=2584121 RepID=A0A848KPI1_9NOCA|nr:heparin-binding hemagglutinin [Antrihabitans stalactiti]NMN98200.1 heparin-binding hemagglutinin [Antrihabitans stalactiti]
MTETTKPIEAARKPLYATVGVGEAAVQTLSDVAVEARARVTTLTADVQEQFEALRERFTGLQSSLPDDVAELRTKLTAEELRKIADEYRTIAIDRYSEFAERGEGAIERLRTRPAIEERIEKAEDLYTKAVEAAEEALGTVSERTRTIGEQAAKLANRVAGRAEDTADAAADKVDAATEALPTV